MEKDTQNLVEAIARVGRNHPSPPPIHHVYIFDEFCLPNGEIDQTRLDLLDGPCTRREVLLRFLLLNAVIDQGPDIVGVRKLLVEVTNELYSQRVRFIHHPLAFFEHVGLAVERVVEKHNVIRKLRAEDWAAENLSTPGKYNLFMDNAGQALSYVVFRWGVPLALPLVLAREAGPEKEDAPLLHHLESFDSAEIMSQQLKDHASRGLGKAIGDKACHLFAKWMVSTFHLTRRTGDSWGPFSFEVPYDSNAGRVLWRTGYLLHWASGKEYQKADVIQPGEGKGGKNYIRVTNIRGMSTTSPLPAHLQSRYEEIAVKHLMTHKRAPRKVEIQRVQHAYLLESFPSTHLHVAHFDDGLIYIGTHYCFNHGEPHCPECPINDLCEACQERPELIQEYRT